jgi:uncharacterized protein YbaP (TraB family)
MKLLSWSDQKPLRMLWLVEKGGQTSHLVGTAHFFPYSFRRSLKRLMRSVETVMFEGPLDQVSSNQIAEYSRQGEDMPAFVNQLTPDAIQEIDRLLRDRLDGQENHAWIWSMVERKPVYFETFTRGMRPYAAFFSIWQTCLGWKYSVDMEGYQIACKLGKQICFLEILHEQLRVLDSISQDRIVRILNDVKNWDEYNQQYVSYYLDGDLENLLNLTSGFATRGEVVIGKRDRIQYERMQPVFERENALAFIGFPHIPGVTELFRENGYSVTQVDA